MTFDPEHVPPPGAKIKVIGVGGGGGNAVNTMIKGGVEGVDFVTCNTDIQALRSSLASHKIQVGKDLTRGLGAGADPDVGRDAALEDRHEIQEYLQGADMVFITAGMGGGTGTGGASVVAQIARELGALTVAVVTKPFGFEGKRRRKHGEVGIARLRECVDTLITIPNERLLKVAAPGLSMIEAFKMADEVLVNAVRGISDIINIPGTVNVDFADVKTVMSCMGQALMGIGRARGEGRALEAARQAISSPLLEDIDIEGATGILINITAGADVTLMEVNEACSIIQEAAHEDANIIFGAVIDETLGDEIRVTVIATGFPVDAYEDAGEPVTSAIAKPAPSVLQQFGSRLTTTPVTAKPAPRATTQPQHYSPLTTRKPAPQATVAPQVEAAPVARPAQPEAAPIPVAAPVAQPQTFAPTAALRPEPAVDLRPSAPAVQAATPAPAPVAAPVRDVDEAAELMRWTLDGEGDETLSLAADTLEDLTQPFAPEAAAEPTAEMPVAEAPLAVEARIEGARVIDDPQDDFAQPLTSEPVASSIFEDDAAFAQGEPMPLGEEPKALFGATADEFGSEPAPLESFFEDEGALIASDIDRKIDEALQLAERMKAPKAPQQGDELDVPAFLRSGMKDLPLG